MNDPAETKPNGYERRSQQKKQAILKTSRKLFSARGITDVSVQEIAEKANVSPVTIYNYFGSKENLAIESLQYFAEEMITEYKNLMASPIPFEQKIEAILNMKQSNIINSMMYFKAAAFADQLLTSLLEKITMEKCEELYLEFILAGKKEGAISTEIPDEALLNFMRAGFLLLRDTDFYQKNYITKESLVRLFMQGILGRSFF